MRVHFGERYIDIVSPPSELIQDEDRGAVQLDGTAQREDHILRPQGMASGETGILPQREYQAVRHRARLPTRGKRRHQ